MALIGCRRVRLWLDALLPAAAAVGAASTRSSRLATAAAAVTPPAASHSAVAWQPPKGAVTTAERSLQTPDYFALDRLVSKQQLMEHRVHLGHRSGCRSEWMTPHLFGCRCGVDIIDLDQTAPMLRRALNFTAHVAARGGIVLFFWQSWPALGPLVERRVSDMGEFAYTRPWVDQVLTDAGNYFDSATRLPDLAVFLSCMSPVMLPHPAVATCSKVMIPTVGICDSNADPRLVTYPVPGNDDSPQAVRLYLALFGEAIRRGKAAFAEWTAASAAATVADSTTESPLSDEGVGGGGRDSFRRAQTQALQRDADGGRRPRLLQSEAPPPSPLRFEQPPPPPPQQQQRPQLHHQRSGQHQRPQHRQQHRNPQQQRPPSPRDER